LWIFSFYVRYSTLLHLPPLRFHCVGGCWDRTLDSYLRLRQLAVRRSNHSARYHPLYLFFRLFPRWPGFAGPPARHPPVRPPAAAATAPEPYHAQRGAAQLPLPLATELPAPLLPPFRAADRRLLSHLWHVGVAVCAAGCHRRRRYSQRAADKLRLWRRRRERSAANFGVVSYAAVFGAAAAET